MSEGILIFVNYHIFILELYCIYIEVAKLKTKLVWIGI
jgi:hypothetical protein